jgi:hypothetical protein
MAAFPIANTGKSLKRDKRTTRDSVLFSVAQQFRRLSFRIHTAFNTEIANCAGECLSLVAETVGWVWATVPQAHRVPAIQTDYFVVRADEARLQKFMRHVSPPPPANVQIRGGECVYRWAEKLGFARALWLWSQYSIDFVLRCSLPSAAANAKAIKRA